MVVVVVCGVSNESDESGKNHSGEDNEGGRVVLGFWKFHSF